MTNEDALEYFQRDVEFCKDSALSDEKYAKDIEGDLAAISALEKQIPLPPTQDAKTKWHCFRCGNWIAERQHFCDKCGQAIDWRCLNVQGS